MFPPLVLAPASNAGAFCHRRNNGTRLGFGAKESALWKQHVIPILRPATKSTCKPPLGTCASSMADFAKGCENLTDVLRKLLSLRMVIRQRERKWLEQIAG
jgi:hypothetical protein